MNVFKLNFIDCLYAAFYAVSYEGLPIGRKHQAGGYAAIIVGAPIGGILAIIIKVCFLRGETPDNFKYVALLMAMTCYGLVNWYYSNDDRDSKAYEAYKARHKVMSKPVFFVLAMLLLCAPFFILGFM